jgi:AcrR family transcriptional regulator
MEMGLRERKKEQTRRLIAETAWRLFADRGFKQVTVAEVAREAQVAVATVFNYFPTKEDLVYGRMESFEDALIQAIRERPAGESILAAFGRFILEAQGLLADKEASQEVESVARMIAESPALLAREHQVLERYADSLARLIREETGVSADDIRPWVTANAMIGMHRALIDYARRRSLAGVPNRRLAREVRMRGEQALAALARGLGELSDWASRGRRG